jgi:DNA repair protein RecO (recombination protein O)
VAWGDPKRLFSIALGEESLKRFSALTEAYVQNQLDRGFHTLEFYKSLK